MKGVWNYPPTHNAYVIGIFSLFLFTLFPGAAALGYAYFDVGVLLASGFGLPWLVWAISKTTPVLFMSTRQGSIFIALAGMLICTQTNQKEQHWVP